MSILTELTMEFNKLKAERKPLPTSITLNYNEYNELLQEANSKYGYEKPITAIDTFMGVKIIITVGESTHGTNNI